MSAIGRRVVRARRDLHGHLWTLGTFVRGVVRPAIPPHDRRFAATLLDPISGTVEVTGRLAQPALEPALGPAGEPVGAREAVIVLHGLGGDVHSRYVVLAARAALDAGLACLRLHLRGADRGGADLYHAALTTELEAALAAPELARFERLYVIGYSLGGHVALTWASSPLARADDRVRAVAAICPPIDLARGVREIQRLDRRPYQFHVLRGLKEHYAAVARRHGERSRVAPIPIDEVRRLRTIIEWDERVVAPRWGFAGADEYYERAGVGPRLASLAVPTLVVAASADPMIPSSTVRPGLARASDQLQVAWARRGGHVGFPDELPLRLLRDHALPGDRRAGIEAQVVAWLRAHG